MIPRPHPHSPSPHAGPPESAGARQHRKPVRPSSEDPQPPTTPGRAHSFVALLRGVNVGGRNRVPMADLRRLLGTLGLERVETFIQSGNAVFESADTDEAALSAKVQAVIARAFGVRSPVIIRSGKAMQRLAASPPFPDADPARVLVLFCAESPAASLDPSRSPDDVVLAKGREVFIHCPGGLARTRFTQDYLDQTLTVPVTGRNWRTVAALAAMTRR